MNKQLIHPKSANIQQKMHLPHKTTVEQVYLKHLKETEAFIPREEFQKKQENFNKIIGSNSAQQLKYYSHINEVRSVKEFVYISEKLKQKNIEKKMNERLELKGKLNKIKEIERKKLDYLQRIDNMLKVNSYEQRDPYQKSFEAFLESVNDDRKLQSINIEIQKETFQKISAQEDQVPTQQNKSSSPKITNQKLGKIQKDLQNSEINDQEEEQEGTSKFLTMKVANKLLGMMSVESSKGKRQPIIWALNKKKELEEILHKPYGGKMNFTQHSFNWLIDNALNKAQSMMTLNKQSINQVMDEKDEYGGNPPNNHQKIQNLITKGIQSIEKTFSKRLKSANIIKPRRELKNRKQVTTQYNVTERIKENVESQALRNRNVQQQQRTESMYLQNDTYVNHFI